MISFSSYNNVYCFNFGLDLFAIRGNRSDIRTCTSFKVFSLYGYMYGPYLNVHGMILNADC